MSSMTPREIVQELDKHIVGQGAAKRAVAIALRNRWRRMQVDEELRGEITPKNILMIGPTGVGKTEIARRLAKLVNAPFLKIEATKFTEVGYVGRDVESIIRDLVLGNEPKRIKVEDILRVVSRHFAVSKADILSDRRHRSVVRPRQIGMYLAKQLTSRSLPEIGRRFGNRDHTTVLHAIRKIDREMGDNPHLKDEIEELKRQLNR